MSGYSYGGNSCADWQSGCVSVSGAGFGKDRYMDFLHGRGERDLMGDHP